ncbi:hypothetical protein FRC02_003299, partial [Tulasnella sp. 418]
MCELLNVSLRLNVQASNFAQSLRSFSTSILEQRYLKCKVKELASALPQLREQAGRPRSLARLNPFREVAVWENEFHSNGTRADSIQETMRILTTLRSYKKIPSAEVARDLICLAKALGGFGMREESGVIFDWGIQICVEMAKNSSSRTLFSLAGFIHEVFLEIAIHGRMDDAARILNHLILVRRQLEEEDQRTHIFKMATALRNTFYQLSGAGRLEASIKAGTEVVQSYRYLAEVDRDTYLGDLSLSLHELAIDLGKDGRHEDAVKAVEEAVNVQRELINQDTKTYLPKLADSLHTLATEMNGTGRREEAIRIAEEAVKMLQVFGERDRRNYSPCLSSSLRGLVAELQNKRQEEVVSVVEKEGVRPKAGEQVTPPPISNSDITVVEDQADDEEDHSITGPFSPPSRFGQLFCSEGSPRVNKDALHRPSDQDIPNNFGLDFFSSGHNDFRTKNANEIQKLDASDPYYLPSGVFSGCYTVPHWMLPPVHKLSYIARHTLSVLTSQMSIIHEPTFRLDKTHAFTAFSLCTTGTRDPYDRVFGGAAMTGSCPKDPWKLVSSLVRQEKADMLVKNFVRRHKQLSFQECFSVVQALLIYHAPSFLAEDRPNRITSQLFLSTIVKIARQTGLYQSDAEWLRPRSEVGDLETQWKTWIRMESIR